jgi:hypothetical protein
MDNTQGKEGNKKWKNQIIWYNFKLDRYMGYGRVFV